MGRRSAAWLAIVVLATGCTSPFDAAPFNDAVAEQFDDGQIMNTEQARCVAEDMANGLDWEGLAAAGLAAEDLFGDTPISDQLGVEGVDVMIEAIDGCRGAAAVVLEIFRTQGSMGDAQISCFASRMTSTASKDLLKLIVADDQASFSGTEGELLLGICGQGVTN